MASSTLAKPRSCHVCTVETSSQTKDVRGSNICGGCEKRFCNRHYKEHRTDIDQQFQKLGVEHDLLLEQLNSIISVDSPASPSVDDINRWETETIDKVRLAAATARENMFEFIQQDHSAVTSQFKGFTDELREKQVNQEYDETDIEEIQSKLSDLQRKIESISDTKVEVKYQQLDWKALILITRANTDSSLSMHSVRVDSGRTGTRTYFVGTTILSMGQQVILNEFYGTPSQPWKLLYKASKDGFRPRDFHRCCDKKGPTMTIYRESKSGYLFGGFTTVDWLNSYSIGRNYQDLRAFLFTLTNPHSLQAIKFPIRDGTTQAVFHHEDFGPSFGMNGSYSDIYFNDAEECHVQFPRSYRETTTFKYGSLIFAGTDSFRLSEIEVFTLS